MAHPDGAGNRIAGIPGLLLLSFLVFFSLCLPVSAQQRVPFHIDLDFAQFRYSADTTYLEIYYSYDESQLTYEAKDGHFEGAMLFNISISSGTGDSLVQDRWWRVPRMVSDISGIVEGKSFVGVIGITNPQGEHLLKITAMDGNNRSRQKVTSYKLPKKAFDPGSVALSDLQLCSSIKRIAEDHSNVFYKNTFEVIPNPARIYGMGAPVLFYYVEAYNMLADAPNGTYRARVSVYDSNGRELSTQEHSKPRVHESSVEVGTVNVNSLPSGSYMLVFSVTDSATDRGVHTERGFFVYNPQRAGGDTVAEELGVMSGEELGEDFAWATYIALDSEKSHYLSLSSPDARKRFLLEFWKRRDSDPGTPVNEFRQQYMGRVNYANIHFRSGSREGWKSDRGRVFIMYGEPDEYERHTGEMGTKAYEVWYYYALQGGVEFVFVDRLGFQDYELVHSTHRDELQDYDWRSKIGDY